MSSSGCRILDDSDLESIQWRTSADTMKIQRVFGSETRKPFPNAFQNDKYVQKSFPYRMKKGGAVKKEDAVTATENKTESQ